MDLTVPVLVSVDRREIFTAQVPGALHVRGFQGPSLARLLDDLALHLMEAVPKMTPTEAASLAFSPYVELRRVKLEVPLGAGKEQQTWKGRLPVVIDRWPKERFVIATLPYLKGRQLAVDSPSALSVALVRYLAEWSLRPVPLQAHELDAAACRAHDYLELLTVDVDLPTILPSRPLKKRRPSRKKAKSKRSDEKLKQKKRVIVPPRTLVQVSENLTHRALDGRLDRAFYRDAIVDDVVRHLGREGAAIVLVGPPGVGKTAIVHEVVARLLGEHTAVNDRRDVWQVDGNRIIAGMSVVGAWEQRVTSMVHELQARQDILYVNDLPALVYTGRSAHADTNVADFLEPHLGRAEIRIIGECTPERLAILQDESPGFLARFRVIQVPPMSERDALHVLLHIARRLDRDEPLAVDPAALEITAALSRRFRALDAHPGKSVDLFTRAVADRTDIQRDRFERRVVTADTIIQHFARQAGLPTFLLFGKGGPTARDVRRFFEHRIVGQPEAVDAAVDAVTTVSQALNDPTRPIATLLFVGPTGVGKTETAKALAEYLFGSKQRLARFDMSEFQHPHAVSRLIGDRLRPDGELTRRVQQQPFSLVLLDEIEKAHPAIFDAMLQVLGEGRLTNAAGRTVSFTTTVVIMTSNLGVRDAERTVGFATPTTDALAVHYRGAAERFFRPEFFNRIDRVVAFRALDRDVIVPLVRRLLSQMLSRQGLKRSSVVVNVDPELAEVLVDQGFDRRYGARSVKRILEQRLAVPLSQHLVEGHGADLRLVEVFPRAQDLGMVVQVPSRPRPPPLKGAVPPKSWKQVEARHAGVRLALEALLESDALTRHGREYGNLLEGLNRGALTEAGQSRLMAIGAVQDQLKDLGESLDGFEDDLLTIEQYVIERTHQLVQHKDYGTRTVAVDEAKPQRATRGPLNEDAVHRLERLELQMARVDYQLQALSIDADDRLLIRFDGYPSPSLTKTVSHWVSAWGTTDASTTRYRPWGAILRLFSSEDGQWRELPDGLGAPADATDKPPSRAFALAIRGRGLRSLLAPELGLWVWQHELGPDYQLDIIRVAEVGDDDDPIDRLAALDASQEAMRAGRRAGQVDGSLWPDAPVRRWFDNDHHVCPQTHVVHGRELRGDFLIQVALRRLHARMMQRVLAAAERG